jgi:hypothetical protein
MDRATARSLARSIAVGRTGVGITAIVAPTLVARPWVGAPAGSVAVKLFARTLGARDLALGIGALRALDRDDDEARPIVALGGMADAVDTLATVVAFAHLPRVLRWGALDITVSSAVLSIRAAEALEGDAGEPQPPEPVAVVAAS